MIINPFEITKAVDYNDQEIFKYWVDVDGNQFSQVMKPHSPMSIILVGSKGSGKTHIMKYYSFQLQKIRYQAQNISLRKGLNEDGFLGIYIRCSGLNSKKYSGKNIPIDVWNMIYAYVWELWIFEKYLSVFIDLRENGIILLEEESKLLTLFQALFANKEKWKCRSFETLRNAVMDLQRKVDYEVQNFYFDNKSRPEVEVLLSLGNISYNIPMILYEHIPFFRDKNIIYIVDELENIDKEKQQVIHSLIREKPVNCTYRIGTRPYGIRTYQTIGGVEENHDGSEFDKIDLDDILRNYEKLDEFLTKICENRMRNHGYVIPEGKSMSDMIEGVDIQDLLKRIYLKKESQCRSYLYSLKSNLIAYKKHQLSERQIDEILNIIRYDVDKIIERTNVILLYKKLKGGSKDVLNDAKKIRESADCYFQSHNNIETEHYKYLNKFKQDVIDMICREGKEPLPYYGFDRLLLLSCGNPRTLLRILKAAFHHQYFNTGYVPFTDVHIINRNSQLIGISKTIEWFYEENRIPATRDYKILEVLHNIGNFLRSLRFSDIPPQCSINVFTITEDTLSNEAREVFDLLRKYSYIIKSNPRREANSDAKTNIYHLNSILLPSYELALGKRGRIIFNERESEVLLRSPQNTVGGDNTLKNRLKECNFPFNVISENRSVQTMLFK